MKMLVCTAVEFNCDYPANRCSWENLWCAHENKQRVESKTVLLNKEADKTLSHSLVKW